MAFRNRKEVIRSESLGTASGGTCQIAPLLNPAPKHSIDELGSKVNLHDSMLSLPPRRLKVAKSLL